ncbi:unnamed protein product [Protopolystoma xenopodis]|uniref:Dynein heavy chain tail domain-containing protein n=1 Tax=Protopolystoma xenopodis TaxID=117903 RepID=A0A448XN64_9PLAT|nr:unnamed protein product [Protopolystoma xenopodis]
MWGSDIGKSLDQLDQAFFLPLNQTGIAEHRAQYLHIIQALEDLTRKIFIEFQNTIDPDPLKCLDSAILARSNQIAGRIEPNASSGLFRLLNELHYWIRLGSEVPHYAAEAQRRTLELHYLYQLCLVICRDYNRIMNLLNGEERLLFRERIKILDKKITPGFSKIHWSVRSMVELFVNDCRIHACRLQSKVDEYKQANLEIKANCELIAQTLMIKLEANRVYENNEFNERQV